MTPTDFLSKKYEINKKDSLLSKAAAQAKGTADVLGQFWYAWCLIELKNDLELATSILKTLAKDSFIPALEYLGWQLTSNQGQLEKDYSHGFEYLCAAEELGSCYARDLMASMHLESGFEKSAITQVTEIGITHHQQNIELNYHASTYALAWALLNEEHLSGYKDKQQIQTMLKKAADFGDRDSQFTLGQFLREQCDMEQALAYLEKAALRNHIRAMEDYANAIFFLMKPYLYVTGIGVKQPTF